MSIPLNGEPPQRHSESGNPSALKWPKAASPLKLASADTGPSLFAFARIPSSPPFRATLSTSTTSIPNRDTDAGFPSYLSERAPLGWLATNRISSSGAVEDIAPALLNSPLAKSDTTDFSYLIYYAYSEVPPTEKPAETVLNSLKTVPEGTAVEEVRRAARAFGLDAVFMEVVARIESDFNPKQRTGSYVGVFQLSNYEFELYGSGEITNARDNAIAAAYKFAVAAVLFEIATHRKATPDDLYLIHQQGTQGASEHVAHPERLAWQSMCATDEGKRRGDRWCKRAVW